MLINPHYSSVRLAGTTDGGGDAVVRSSGATPLFGDVISVLVDGIALTDSANLTLVEELTGAAGTVTGPNIINNADIGNATLTDLRPSAPLQDEAGVAQLSGTDDVPTLFTLHGGTLKATVSAGGGAKAFVIWVTLRG